MGVLAPQMVDLEAFRQNRGWFLVLGILIIILGMVALSCTVTTTLFSILLLGWVLIITGVVEAVGAFWEGKWGGFFLHLVVGILYAVVGFMLVANPEAAALSLTFILAVFFIVAGIFRIITALSMQFPQWGWLLFNGIVTLILGVLIWRQWPYSGLWVIGLFIAIELLITGWTWVMLSLAARRLTPQEA
jgi:uncharacterized membrane protein HdeD (DUF308 family)